MEITKNNVENIRNAQKYELVYSAYFKSASWVVGTKNDPKKEFGTVQLSFIVPKSDGTFYTKDVDCYISDKLQMPTKMPEPFSKVYVVFEFNKDNPLMAGRFVRIVE